MLIHTAPSICIVISGVIATIATTPNASVTTIFITAYMLPVQTEVKFAVIRSESNTPESSAIYSKYLWLFEYLVRTNANCISRTRNHQNRDTCPLHVSSSIKRKCSMATGYIHCFSRYCRMSALLPAPSARRHFRLCLTMIVTDQHTDWNDRSGKEARRSPVPDNYHHRHKSYIYSCPGSNTSQCMYTGYRPKF